MTPIDEVLTIPKTGMTMEEFVKSNSNIFKRPEIGEVTNQAEYDIEVEKIRFGKYKVVITFVFPNGSSFTFVNKVRTKKKAISWLEQVVKSGLGGI